MQVNKKELLKAFEEVKPGLTQKEIIEQSNSFGFSGNHIVTYNDEISIRHPIDLDLEGAVEAQSFYNILNKFKPDKEGNIEIEVQGNEIILKAGKKAKAGLKLHTELKLPLKEVELSDKLKWLKVPDLFKEGIKFCLSSASKDMSKPILTCLDVSGSFIYSSDNVRASRFDMKKRMKSFLLPSTVASQLIKYGIKEYIIKEEWCHFKTENSTIFSCRIFNDTFPDLSAFIEIEGEELTFPKDTIDVLDKAGVFSKRDINADEVVHISIGDKKMKIRGEGDSGWYEQTLPFRYSGDSLTFEVNPSFLKDILSDSSKCALNSEKGLIKFQNDNWTYIASILI